MKYILIWYIIYPGYNVTANSIEFNDIKECIFAKNQIEKQWTNSYKTVKALCLPKGEGF